MKVKSASEPAQSCPISSDPMDCSPPCSSVHGIFQARVLELGVIAFSIKQNRVYQIGRDILLPNDKLSYQVRKGTYYKVSKQNLSLKIYQIRKGTYYKISKHNLSLKIVSHTLSSTKEARIYNGLKTISLTSTAGKTGQPLVKE